MCSSLASSAESKMTLFIALPFFFRLDELTCFVFLQLYLSANDPVNIDESFFLIDQSSPFFAVNLVHSSLIPDLFLTCRLG